MSFEMQTKQVTTIALLRHFLANERNQERSIGFVPTMGYLHEGHLSLIDQARQQCDVVVVSIFVNPTQFGPTEDYETYPRNLDRDIKLCQERGVAFVFTPSVDEMYPDGVKDRIGNVSVAVSERLSDVLCGRFRPGHFNGMATVVLKLLNIVQPHRAYFGLKDAQQLAIVQQMVTQFHLPVTIVPCETIREEDGLAKSSRNVYLNEQERKQAPVIHEALSLAAERASDVNMTVKQLLDLITAHLQTADLARIEYVDLLTYPGLERVKPEQRLGEALKEPCIVATAVKFGDTRLIDNQILKPLSVHEGEGR